ncbi:hypothetical protein NFI96_009528 [Prochilodus magdalenae]|nr:hypothetical protein NFI96_009528 [Prochilodus magdalenae]
MLLQPPNLPKKDTSSIVFNKVEVGEEYVEQRDEAEGEEEETEGERNPHSTYGEELQTALSRVEAMKARLEELREKDEGESQEGGREDEVDTTFSTEAERHEDQRTMKSCSVLL